MVIIFFLTAIAIIIIALVHECWNMILLFLKSEKYQSAQQGERGLFLFGMFCLITSLGKGGPSLEYWPELSNTRQRDCNAGEARDNVMDQECYT